MPRQLKVRNVLVRVTPKTMLRARDPQPRRAKKTNKKQEETNGTECKRAVKDKELCLLAKTYGMQSQRSARALVRGTFFSARDRHLAIMVFLSAIESAKRNHRKRVMLKKDVEPALQLVRRVSEAAMLVLPG